MRFFDWLFGNTPSYAGPPPTVVIAVTVDEIEHRQEFVPDLAAIEMSDLVEDSAPVLELPVPPATAAPTVKLSGPRDCGDAFCVLDYCDSKGHRTERRVSLRTVTETNGTIYLNAFCLERKAPRQFRLDRINHFISEDGEVIEPIRFLQEEIGLQLRDATPQEAATTVAVAAYLAAMRPGIAVLTAAARADGKVHPAEIDAVQIWSEHEAMYLSRSGTVPYAPTIDVIEGLARHIEVMRPMMPGLKVQVGMVAKWPPARVRALFKAIQSTIIADGVVTSDEMEFVDDLQRTVG